MAISLNQAQTIVQKLSNEQLMKSYTDGSLPQFIVFSEMQNGLTRVGYFAGSNYNEAEEQLSIAQKENSSYWLLKK